MNETIKKIIETKSVVMDSYIENMKYYDIIGFDDKTWNRLQKIKKELQAKLNAEIEKIKVADAALTLKVDAIAKDSKGYQAKVEKLMTAAAEKTKKIQAKMAEIQLDIDSIPDKRYSAKLSDKRVPASIMKPEYMAHMKENTAEIKARYSIA